MLVADLNQRFFGRRGFNQIMGRYFLPLINHRHSLPQNDGFINHCHPICHITILYTQAVENAVNGKLLLNCLNFISISSDTVITSETITWFLAVIQAYPSASKNAVLLTTKLEQNQRK
jgi:hypothetical protein